MSNPVLEIRDLTVSYPGKRGRINVVDGANLIIREGEAVGLIGESGSGKSTIALAVFNYLARGGKVEGGDVLYRGESLLKLSPRRRREIYGRMISLVPQEPVNALNPVLDIGTQITEVLNRHLGMSGKEARGRAVELLRMVQLAGAEELLRRYPHQLSGGMQQRVFIAMALACDPDVIVMDEPTTGLDATTEAKILELIEELKTRIEASILFISHDLGVVSRIADRVAIMYRGKIVESGPVDTIFRMPAHRYTRMLLDSVPRMTGPVWALRGIPWQSGEGATQGCAFMDRCDIAVEACKKDVNTVTVGPEHVSSCVQWEHMLKVAADARPSPGQSAVLAAGMLQGGEGTQRRVEDRDEGALLVIEGLSKEFEIARRGLFGLTQTIRFRAVDNVNLTIRAGQTFAIVGESGSGKSTLARTIMGLHIPTDGRILYGDRNLAQLAPRYPVHVRRDLQMVFQNVQASLHPHKTIRAILSRPFELYEGRRPDRAELVELLHRVNLDENILERKPTELSGGQKQRIGILRAFACRPKLVILDEALSALDVSLRATVVQLLSALKNEFGTTYLFISHDIPIVRYIADEIAVMYLGWVCEAGPNRRIFDPPYHPYTEALLSSVADPEPRKSKPHPIRLRGLPPAPGDAVVGCRFHTRCPRKIGSICEKQAPPIQRTDDGHMIACHIPLDDLREMQENLTSNRVTEAVR